MGQGVQWWYVHKARQNGRVRHVTQGKVAKYEEIDG